MLIDTSGFLCLYESDEPFHKRAVKFFDSAKHLLTTNYVLAEYTALAQIRGVPRRQIIDFSEAVLEDQSIEIVWVDEFLHRKAVELIGERRDKNYSICDAVSFVIMTERKIAESLTSDKHFIQEGFIALLR